MTTVETIESYVEGRWARGQGKAATLTNPTTEAPVATADTHGLDFGRALAFARDTGGKALRELSFKDRAELLFKMSQVTHKAREELIETEVVNQGCTRGDAKFDVDGAIGTLAAYAELGKKLGDARVLADGEGVQLGRSPRLWGQHIYSSKPGVAVLINAFNFPAWGFAEKAACSILAGMPVVSKPATSTALTAYRMTKHLVEHAGLPAGAMSFVGGGPGDMLDHLGAQDVLAFTGSANTAATLRARSNVIERSIRVNVEADSLNAMVLGPDVTIGSEALALFLRECAKDMTQKTGQKCTAVRRIFVPESIAADVIAELSSRLEAVKIGDPSQNDTGMGPLATKSQLEEIRRGVALLQKDADVVFGDPTKSFSSGYFHPILLFKARDAANATHVHTHEVFGPVATIVPYSGDADEAARLVALGQGCLVSSIYSDDKAFIERATASIAPWTGRVYIAGAKVADHTMGPGTVLPLSVHGGPGRAGGGEELGGMRGVFHYMQRTAVQGYRPIVEGIAGKSS